MVKNQVVRAKAEVAAVEIEAEEVVAVVTAAVEAKAEAQAMVVAIEDVAAVVIETEVAIEKEHQELKELIEAAMEEVKAIQIEAAVHLLKEADMEPEMVVETETMVIDPKLTDLPVTDQLETEDVEEIS